MFESAYSVTTAAIFHNAASFNGHSTAYVCAWIFNANHRDPAQYLWFADSGSVPLPDPPIQDPEAYWTGRPHLEASGIPPEVADDLLSQNPWNARTEWKKQKAWRPHSRHLASGYPPCLGDFRSAVILYKVEAGIGSSPGGDRWNAAPTSYGLNCAERVAGSFFKSRLHIRVGEGIDSAAHRGALRGGATYAVFGCGLDTIYPRENRKLAEMVEEKGAVLSEFPLGTPPSPENFPIRNRIIAGMSLGVIVVEAAEYSGSLITARLSVDSNRGFCDTGNITSPNSFGPRSDSARAGLWPLAGYCRGNCRRRFEKFFAFNFSDAGVAGAGT
jgi:hypothetical protein